MPALLWSLLVFGTFAALAAWTAEQARWLVGASRRLPWLVALIATATWPLTRSSIAHTMALSPVATAFQLPPLLIGAPAGNAASSAAPWIARGLVIAWGLASLVLLVRLVRAARSATEALRSGTTDVVDGAPVVLSEGAGPAVVGWMQPHVLWPRWLSEIDPALQQLILRHEREHCRAHDPRWILAAECAVVLMPWHPAIWWMRHRLRAAVELDCDARVLAGAHDATRYGRLLMLLAQRQPSLRLASMLAEPRSLLSRRILTMTTPRPSHPALRATLFSLTAIAAVVTACSSALNQAGMAPKAQEAASAMPAAVAAPQTYFEYQVEQPVQYAPGSVAPKYPAAEKAAGIEGEVLVQFIVGTDGLAEPGSFKVLRRTGSGSGTKQSVPVTEADYWPFELAVRDALPGMRFAPARLHGTVVRQLVQQPFVFAIQK